MKKKIEKKALVWKRLFAQGCENVDETSTWREILKSLGFIRRKNYLQIADRFAQAVVECGTFSAEEREFLSSLSGYKEVMWFLTTQRAPESSFEEQISRDTKVVCHCYPSCNVAFPIVECTIVTEKPAPLSAEVYVFVSSYDCNIRKHGVIRFEQGKVLN